MWETFLQSHILSTIGNTIWEIGGTHPLQSDWNAGDITYMFKEVELQTQTGGFFGSQEGKKKKQDGTTRRLKKLVLKTKKN